MVSLVDVHARLRGEDARSRPFLYPKVWLHPYTDDTQRLEELPVPPAAPEDIPPFALLIDPAEVGAVLEAIPLDRPVVPNAPRHVRNCEYRVRWRGEPNNETTIEPYLLVWHTNAFAEFIQGANLQGHIPPTAYALKHRASVNQLIHNRAPDRDVLLADPSVAQPGRQLSNYIIHHHSPSQRQIQSRSQSQSQSQSQQLRFQGEA